MLRVAVVLCLVAAVLGGPPVSKSRAEIEKFREYLESSRTDKGVILPSNPKSSEWAKSGKYQGDILLDDQQIEDLVKQFSSGRNAYIVSGTRWPGNTVIYQFAAGHFNQEQTNWILHVMRILEQNTCIRFQQRTNQASYALITGNADGCYANVGYWATRGVHIMNVARNNPGWGCMNGVIIAHEWLHVIGFFHMQSTYDRDNWVRINWENIIPGMAYNFDRYGQNTVSNLGLPYEYDSCMHYGAFDFSSNGRTTIDALRPHSGVMGQTDYITGWDFWRVDRHYGCAAWRKAEDYQKVYAARPEGQEAEVIEEAEQEEVLPQEDLAPEVENVQELRV